MVIASLSRFGAFVTALLLTQLPQVLKPVDDASQDPALVAVRSEAIDALRAGSSARFMALVTEDPSLGDFGHGRQVLRRMLDSDTNPAAAHPSMIDEILTALSMGGAFTSINGERRFCAPYVYGAYPSSYPMPNETDRLILVILR